MLTPYYQDESTTIYHGDCREILPTLGRFDLLLTDPPYGIGADKKKAHRSIRDNPEWEEQDWDRNRPERECFDMMRLKSSKQMIWGGNYFADFLPPSSCWLVWDKGQREFSLADAELAWTSQVTAVRVFGCPRCRAIQDGKVHPTQKPLALMQWCIGQAGDSVQSILDPFMGSGTTLVAAKLEGRKAAGIELNEKYCEAAANRLCQGVLF